MGIQINGQTDTISSTDGSLNIGGTVTVQVTGDATGLTGTPDITVGAVTASSAVISGDLTVNGTTTTLDTTLTEVDKLEVGANNTTVGVAITQSGSGDILRLYDSATQVVTVKDGGLVGIGTDNPSAKLHLSDTSGALIINRETDSLNQINFRTINTHRGSIGADSSACFTVYDASSQEKLRITSSGKVGIGTDNPQGTLSVSGNISLDGALGTIPSRGGITRHTNGYTYFAGKSDGSGAILTNGDGTATVRAESPGGSNGYLLFETGNGTERLRINSSGNLILDAGGDAQDIQIISHSAASGHGQIYMRGNASGESSSIKLNHFGYADYIIAAGRSGNGLFSITNNDGGSDGIIMNSSGNVGIGLTNPSAKLSISGSENTVVEIQPNISSGVSRILSFNRVSNAYRTLRLDGSEMKLETSSVPKLRIAANGNIGIGDDFDANNYARLSVYEDNYTYGRSLAPTSTGQYGASYSPPVGTLYYRNNTDSGAIGVRHYVQAEQGYPNAQDYLDVLIKNSAFYTIRIKASNGSASAAVATMLVYGLANSTNSNHPVVSITGASGGGTSNPTFASGHGKGSSNAVATFWWEVLNYNVNTYDCTMRIHTTHANNQGLRAIIEECVG